MRRSFKSITHTFLFTALLPTLAFAEGYQNTSEEKTRFIEFLTLKRGTLICEAVSGYIYGKGVTTRVIGDEVRDRYYLSAYNNETQQWIVQNVELTLRAPVIEEVRDEYASFREPSRSFSLDLGMGSMRDFASNLGDSEATPSFPYAASLHYQFHNVCTIANL